MRIGVYGGSFNPPHLGHVVLAVEAREQLALDRVLWVPAARPPHKRTAAMLPDEQRLALCEAAVADLDGVEVSAVEFEREGLSYTADTLQVLAGRYPDCELYLLIGVDQALVLRSWRDPETIDALAHVAVAGRDASGPAAGLEALRWLSRPAVGLDLPVVELSSTLVRARRAAGRAWRHLVPAAVADLIDAWGVYGQPAHTASRSCSPTCGCAACCSVSGSSSAGFSNEATRTPMSLTGRGGS